MQQFNYRKLVALCGVASTLLAATGCCGANTGGVVNAPPDDGPIAHLPFDIPLSDLCMATGQGRQCKPDDGAWQGASGLVKFTPTDDQNVLADRYLARHKAGGTVVTCLSAPPSQDAALKKFVNANAPTPGRDFISDSADIKAAVARTLAQESAVELTAKFGAALPGDIKLAFQSSFQNEMEKKLNQTLQSSGTVRFARSAIDGIDFRADDIYTRAPELKGCARENMIIGVAGFILQDVRLTMANLTETDVKTAIEAALTASAPTIAAGQATLVAKLSAEIRNKIEKSYRSQVNATYTQPGKMFFPIWMKVITLRKAS